MPHAEQTINTSGPPASGTREHIGPLNIEKGYSHNKAQALPSHLTIHQQLKTHAINASSRHTPDHYASHRARNSIHRTSPDDHPDHTLDHHGEAAYQNVEKIKSTYIGVSPTHKFSKHPEHDNRR